MKKHRLIAILLALLLGPSVKSEQTNEVVITSSTAEGKVNFDFETGKATGINGVIVTYGQREMVLLADKVELSKSSGEVLAEGNVSLQRGDALWLGDRLEYNYRTREMRADSFRTGLSPFYAKGLGLAANTTNKTYSATNAVITTDDVSSPSYRIRAERITIVPGQYIEARNATLMLGNVPVMFFPKYHRSLTRHPNNIELTPGYRSVYGPYLLGTYNWYLNDQLSGSVHADYRQRRGFGLGPDVNYDIGRWGQGGFTYYYTHDEDPKKDPQGNDIQEYRRRLSFSHKATLRTNLTAKVVVRDQSDAYFIRDFFESEYRTNSQPRSFLEVNQAWSNFTLDVMAQPQINDFVQTIERLPDVKLSAIRQQLGASPFFYESESSAAYLRFGSVTNTRPSYAALRADSYHQILLPHTFFGWLNFTPRVGGRFTHYGETEGLGSTMNEQDRFVFNTGAETSFKASRVWGGVHNQLLEMDGLRHIIEPSVNYVFVPAPNKRPFQLPQFDSELPSLRLLPIEFPDYNSIDSIDSQNVFRFSLRNKVQTKRKDGVDNLVNWGLYTDWRLNPNPGQGTFADAYSDLDFKPRSWLTLNSEIRYDLDNGHVRMANHAATLTPNDVWSVSLGHRYFREDPAFGLESANNLVYSRIYYRLNENWGFRMSHHFEARDGTLEEQYYTVYRDLRSWTTALTFRVRENRGGPQDVTIALTFSLKAFPRFKPGSDRESPSLLLGG